MKSKLIALALLTFLYFNNVIAQIPNYDWVIESDGPNNESITGVAVDNNNNSYILGQIGSVANSFTIGGVTISDANGKIFLCKLDAEGNVLWTRSTGLTPNGASTSVANLCIDGDGNVYFSGVFSGIGKIITIGSTTLTSSFACNACYGFYIAKYNTNGDFQWVNPFNGVNVDAVGGVGLTNLKVDHNNDLIGTLGFTGFSITMNGNTYLAAGSSSPDVLVVKFNSSGVALWSKLITSVNTTYARGIAVDNDNNIYVCGETVTSTTFDPNWILTEVLNEGILFLVKYNSSGDVQAAKKCNTLGSGELTGIDVFENDRIILTGNFTNELVLDTVTITPNINALNGFLAVYDIGATALWAKAFETNTATSLATVTTKKLSIDYSGNITVGGAFTNDVTIEGTTFFNSGQSSTYDAFIVQYDLDGNLIWRDAYGSIVYTSLTGIESRPDGKIMIAGGYNGPSINIGSFSFTNSGYVSGTFGYDDFFLAAIGGENSIEWTGNTSTNWNEITNWEPQQIPTDDDNIIIHAGRPHYPLIVLGNDVACKKINIETGATLKMHGGVLSVWGEITAPDADVFGFDGGILSLFHGSDFPENMEFYHLNITNYSDAEEENIYQIPGFTKIEGDFKMYGTITEPNLPKVKLNAGDNITVYKNFLIEKGMFGNIYPDPIPAGNDIPSVRFAGTTTQTIKLINNSVNSGEISATVIIDNPNAKFTNTGINTMLNLIVGSNFDLAGKTLLVQGRIAYLGGITTSFTILNSVPSKGVLVIGNDPERSINNQSHIFKCSQLRALRFGGYGINSNDTLILLSSLKLDTLRVGGYLDLHGNNLTIGGASTQLGVFEVDSLTTSINSGTLTLNPSSFSLPYEINAWYLNNLNINNSSGAKLMNEANFSSTSFASLGLRVYGTIKLTDGDLNLNDNDIKLAKFNPDVINKGKVVETTGNNFVNYGNNLAFMDIDTIVGTPVTNQNFGGLGFIISSVNPIQELNIRRCIGYSTDPNTDLIFDGIIGGTDRFYFVENHNVSGLNARVSIKYDESEILGVDETDLGIFRRNFVDPVGVWEQIPASVNTATNRVTTINLLSQLDTAPPDDEVYTFYTLASVSGMLRIEGNYNQQSVSNTTHILVYPNPFTNQLTVNLISAIDENATVLVIDLAGRLMNEEPVQLQAGLNDISICCIDNLPAGVYMLRIISSQTNSIVKVVKD